MSLVNVARLMTDTRFCRTFVRRRQRGTFSNQGEYTSAYDEQTVTGIVQPATPDVLKILPEGTRLDSVRCVWSAEGLRVGDGKSFESDVLVIDGESFKVIRAEDWSANGYFEVYVEGFVT